MEFGHYQPNINASKAECVGQNSNKEPSIWKQGYEEQPDLDAHANACHTTALYRL
jgi:hypothetical protein